MRAGQLNERIPLYRKVTIRNDYNEAEEQYKHFRDVYAEINARESKQTILANAEAATSSIVLNVRLYQDVQPTDQLDYNGSKYEVVSVVIDKKNAMKSIVADWRRLNE